MNEATVVSLFIILQLGPGSRRIAGSALLPPVQTEVDQGELEDSVRQLSESWSLGAMMVMAPTV